VAEPVAGREHQAEVSIPAVVGVIGPDVLASTRVTIVALGPRSLCVEGPEPLAEGDAVALGCRLTGEAVGPEVQSVLAVAVVTGRAVAVAGGGWRSPLVIEQIEGADGERLAAVATRADFRGAGGHR
jgi:hypothetical protein